MKMFKFFKVQKNLSNKNKCLLKINNNKGKENGE